LSFRGIRDESARLGEWGRFTKLFVKLVNDVADNVMVNV